MKFLVSVVLALILSAWGCSENASDSAPSTPSIPLTSVTFSGTVPVGGSDFHSFSANDGLISVTLTVAGPPPTISMGLGIGVLDGDACRLLPGATTTTSAGPVSQLSGTVSAGTFCVQVYDVGNQTAPVDYSVSVITHL